MVYNNLLDCHSGLCYSRQIISDRIFRQSGSVSFVKWEYRVQNPLLCFFQQNIWTSPHGLEVWVNGTLDSVTKSLPEHSVKTLAFLCVLACFKNKKCPLIWDKTLLDQLKSNRGYGWSSLATCLKLVSSFAYYSTLMKKAKFSSETLIEFQRTTRRYSP